MADSVKISTWNLNGWTLSNSNLRSSVIKLTESQIFCVNETHLTGNLSIEIEGFTWIGHNRTNIHRKAKKGSGGVGIFVSNSLLVSYKYEIIDKSQDGIICVRFTHNPTMYSFIIFACYFPPESSPWGRNADSFFNHILSLLYVYNDNVDSVFVMGDLNARIGTLNDCLQSDNLPERSPIDLEKNNHGENLIEFLLESRMCILNGRYDPHYDDYTFLSTRGKSVVDYIITCHENINNCKQFSVIQMTDILDKHDLQYMLTDKCKTSDHAIISVSFSVTSFMESNKTAPPKVDFNKESYKYNLKCISPEFLATARFKSELKYLCNVLSQNNSSLDVIYNEFSSLIIHEMKTYLKHYKHQTHKRDTTKPYWDKDLSELWEILKLNERKFRKSKKNANLKNKLRQNYVIARNNFDRTLRNKERNYNKLLVKSIEMSCKNNPKRFWNLINNLGPKRKNKLSRNLAVSIEGNLYFDRFSIESKWFEDFQRLYNGPTNGQLVINKNACFLNQIITRVANRERQMLDQSYEENIMLNSGISFDEIENVVQKLKKNKSVGIDQIPNEILYYFDIMVFMYDLFNYCYTNGVVPTAWAKAIISPVLKPGKDPHFPFSYRGISLLSCMGKVFSSVISNKIVYYCDSLNL